MNEKLVRTFIEVAECRSFSQAEKHLFLSKQAIVKQIDNLETELGCELFYRSSQGVTLTPAGIVYLKGVKEIITLSEQLVEDCLLAASQEKKLRIENSRHPHLLLHGAIDEMKQNHPQIKIDISLSSDHNSGERILKGLIDVAEVPGCKDIQQAGISYSKLIDFPYKCLVHESNPLASKKELLPEDLSGCCLVMNNPKFRHTLIHFLNAHATNITIEKGTGDEMEQAYTACYNNKVYLSTAYYMDYLPHIKAIPIRCDLTQEFGLIYSSTPSNEVLAFLAIAQEYCNALYKTP